MKIGMSNGEEEDNLINVDQEASQNYVSNLQS